MWLKKHVMQWASNHSTFILQCFLVYSYYLHTFRDIWNRYFKKSTKLTLPEHPIYFAKCIIHKPSNDNNIYHLYFESHTDELTPLLTSDTDTIYLYINRHDSLTLCNKNANEPTKLVTQSNAKFINILYSNPDCNKEPLTLKIDHSYMVSDNEILCPVHVLYLLQTQYEKSEYVFNLNYQLKIMDNNFAITVLNASQYLHLTNTNKGFIVKYLNKYINQ